MAKKTLREAFIKELRDIYGGEQQIIKALRKLSKAASAPQLRKAFTSHLEESREHVSRLERVFANFDEKVRAKRCDGVSGIIKDARSLIDDNFDKATLDACLIASVQRVEHYEIAVYGALVVWARTLGNDEAADLLEETLDEEKAADEALSALAMRDINDDAAADDADADADAEADSPTQLPLPVALPKRHAAKQPAKRSAKPPVKRAVTRPAGRKKPRRG